MRIAGMRETRRTPGITNTSALRLLTPNSTEFTMFRFWIMELLAELFVEKIFEIHYLMHVCPLRVW